MPYPHRQKVSNRFRALGLKNRSLMKLRFLRCGCNSLLLCVSRVVLRFTSLQWAPPLGQPPSCNCERTPTHGRLSAKTGKKKHRALTGAPHGQTGTPDTRTTAQTPGASRRPRPARDPWNHAHEQSVKEGPRREPGSENLPITAFTHFHAILLYIYIYYYITILGLLPVTVDDDEAWSQAFLQKSDALAWKPRWQVSSDGPKLYKPSHVQVLRPASTTPSHAGAPHELRASQPGPHRAAFP